MILKIANNIYTGSIEGLIFTNKKEWAIIHASQKYHYYVMDWNYADRKPDKNHPNYLFYQFKDEISLNWVDGRAELYDWVGVDTFNRLLDFIEDKSKNKKVFIHCDKGLSRSPTVGLLYLAKRTNILPSNSYEMASKKFRKTYPQYNPGGLAEYISDNWEDIV